MRAMMRREARPPFPLWFLNSGLKLRSQRGLVSQQCFSNFQVESRMGSLVHAYIHLSIDVHPFIRSVLGVTPSFMELKLH